MKGFKINRRELLRGLGLTVGAMMTGGCAYGVSAPAGRKNVLFIAVDDMNDWVGCVGGHPQAKTPHMDRLAREGGMVFSRAYCAATVCCPSRSALMTGVLPSESGVYGNSQNLKNAERTKDAVTITEYFSQHGYHTASRGKIFHKHPTAAGMDEGQWAYDEFVKATTAGGRSPDTSNGPANRMPMLDGTPGRGSPFDWGATTGVDEGTKDYQTALWAAKRIKEGFDKPFFMAVGISKPHLPFFVPQKYFDIHPLDDVIVPEYREDDLDDIKRPDGKNKFGPTDDFLRVKKYKRFKEVTRAYLACVSYADDCIGVMLDALAESEYADNTVIVIWGDHGWYLGEKLKYRKTHLWEESARVPLIVKSPGVTPSGKKCERVVNLMDLYPTLVDVCGLPKKTDIAGRSFAPLLADPTRKWDYPTLTTMQRGNHSVRDERWRYTRYADGVEELYDHNTDHMEWTNLADRPELEHVKKRLAKYMPVFDAPDAPRNTIDKKKLRKRLRNAAQQK